MNFEDDFPSYSKTKNNMYSTMAPGTTPRRRYQDSGRTTTMRRSLFEKNNNPENSVLNSTFTKELRNHKKQLKTPNLPEIKK